CASLSDCLLRARRPRVLHRCSPVLRPLYPLRHPLHLHSFPTRRSSDLELLEFVATEVDELESKREMAHIERIMREGTGADRMIRDRKSTRLNSSHVEISYAVFCLKKKKKEGVGAGARAGRKVAARWSVS